LHQGYKKGIVNRMSHRYDQFFRLFWLGLLVSSFANAAGLKLKWQANTEADLAGYKIHVGSVSRTYDRSVDVGDTTLAVIGDLTVGIPYFISVTAYDRTGNESIFSQEINVTLGDTQAPTLVSITPLSRTELLLVFSEPVEEKAIQASANFRIEPTVAVKSVKLQSDGKTALITTLEHQSGLNYTLFVNNVTDRALPGNVIKSDSKLAYMLGTEDGDTTPPVLNMATLTSATQLTLYFSEPLDAVTATVLSNYTGSNGIQIKTVSLSSDGGQVQLTTSEHVGGVSYSIAVSNVTDRSSRKNKMPDNSSYTYTYDPGDVTGPVMTLVNGTAQDRVEIMFNEPVEKTSAETVANYSINSGMQVLAAQLDNSGQVLRLQTSNHVANQLYVITVNNVIDRSDRKNKIATNSTFSYLFAPADQTGPTIAKVVIKDFTHVLVSFSEALDRASAEEPGNYIISNSVRVFNAKLGSDGKSVEMETTPHVSGQLYLLQVNKVRDASAVGNEILANSSYAYVYGAAEPTTGPTIVEVKPLSANSLSVVFNKPVEKAGAQTIANYTLNRGATVSSATLDVSGTRVTLQTSTHEPDKIYILSISNIFDAGGNRNLILPNSSYNYIFEASDQVGPVVTLVKVIDSEHLDVLFNERVASDEANRSTNYSISGSIQVKSAVLDAGRRIVHLTTDRHNPQTLYVLRINGVVDEAAFNVIAANSSYSYLYEPSDAMAPTIAMVRVKDVQHLEVVFSEAVDYITALDVRNYSLNNNLEIKSAKKGTANHLVELEIGAMQPGKIYVAIVNQVTDEVGNRIVPNSSYTFTFGDLTVEQVPAIANVYSYSPAELYVIFNMKVSKEQAENPTNYTVQGRLTISSAKLDGSMTQVRLQTSNHEQGRIYALMANNISRWDRPDLVIKQNMPFFYTLQQDEKSPPKLDKVEIEGENLLRVTFSQPVEKLSAENRRNYRINENVAILSAEWQSDPSQVLIETARHQAGKAYTLAISGVKSSNAGATMTDAVMAYTYMPSLEIKVDGVAEAMISYADVGRPYYVDRNYVITAVPDDLLRAKMIMTANNDRTLTDSRFMVIQLSKSALVYVAYDDDAQSAPNWLDANFVKSERFLGVSESSNRLRLWRGFFPSGRLVLGGNAAVGSRGTQMMYVVLIQEGDFSTTPGGGYTEGSGLARKIPESVNLLSNYPNPFNPRTTIRFDLPFDKEVLVTVYDILGRKVRTLYHDTAGAGQHTVVWDGANEDNIPVAAGIYFYRMDAWENGVRNGLTFKENYESFTRKMTLLK
jgi:hypothetical protein